MLPWFCRRADSALASAAQVSLVERPRATCADRDASRPPDAARTSSSDRAADASPATSTTLAADRVVDRADDGFGSAVARPCYKDGVATVDPADGSRLHCVEISTSALLLHQAPDPSPTL